MSNGLLFISCNIYVDCATHVTGVEYIIKGIIICISYYANAVRHRCSGRVVLGQCRRQNNDLFLLQE